MSPLILLCRIGFYIANITGNEAIQQGLVSLLIMGQIFPVVYRAYSRRDTGEVIGFSVAEDEQRHPVG